jgi:hypothetical protein
MTMAMQVPKPVTLMAVPKSDREKIRLLMSTLREIGASARCVETRMLASRVLRMCGER